MRQGRCLLIGSSRAFKSGSHLLGSPPNMARSSIDAVVAKIPKGPKQSRRARGAFTRLLRRFASRSDSGSSRATFEEEPSPRSVTCG